MLKESNFQPEKYKTDREFYINHRGSTSKAKTSQRSKKLLSLPTFEEMKVTISPDIQLFTPDANYNSYNSVEIFNITSPKRPVHTTISKSRTSVKNNKDDIVKNVMDKFSIKNRTITLKENQGFENFKQPISLKRQKTAMTLNSSPKARINKQVIFPNLGSQNFKRQKSQFSLNQLSNMDNLLQKINDDKDIKDLKSIKKSIKKCESEFAAKIGDLKKISKIDLDELKEQRAKRWTRNKFKDYEKVLSGKEVLEMLGKMKDEFRKLIYS